AAVIGAGVMGATIAAHLANVGLPTILLDIVPPQLTDADQAKGWTEQTPAFRDKFAQSGLRNALKQRPAAFYVPEAAKLIKTGNLDDNLEWIKECQWIIEVVVENIDIKKKLFRRIEEFRTPGTLVTTNTSGIPVADMSQECSDDFQKYFCGTHFFNPPRYMKLLEIIPGPKTLPEVVDFFADFCERRLGKGVVFAKDTPNFIANRIGTFGMMHTVKTMLELGLSFSAVDALTGPAIGRPKSATFGTADLVGLDTLCHVAGNVFDGAPDDEQRNAFKVPDLFRQMLDKGLLGRKSKAGFFKMVKENGKKQLLELDPRTLEYGPKQKAKFPSVGVARNLDTAAEKIKHMYWAQDDGGKFIQEVTGETLIYAANRLGEIADDIVNIDHALEWGFAWDMGPFETWDAIGPTKSVEAMNKAGKQVPAWVAEMLDAGRETFYVWQDGVRCYYDPTQKDYVPVPLKAEIILLPALKERQKVVAQNTGGTIYDLDDGVLGLEFHTKMNALGDDIGQMMNRACDLVEEDGWEGIVIANHGQNFSVGANLMLVLFTAQEEEWDDLHFMVKGLQDTLMRFKFLRKPVVAAPHQMALGGGCEVALACDRVRPAAESYIGLVEVGVGVVPAGGGCKELLIRNTEGVFEVQRGGLYPKQIDLTPFVARAFETIALGKVATSAKEAIKMGFLRET
ncbi:MAG: 3-hydroxyacyl-CoA dehydrogenase/enoyl-CoA hydratase family protein, partial [Proteobacteria bacterium]|nr:3-hydroxyacyl-CoA dehydrogenase/enoyl-CoA hydratase family protein [Pseudomonadota bacterium]